MSQTSNPCSKQVGVIQSFYLVHKLSTYALVQISYIYIKQIRRTKRKSHRVEI